ncbi:MAG: MFS transporter, partial [Candidatus Adiutrix sp.]|nr:MFS transporter [Candidatus Adiutrix sp.]
MNLPRLWPLALTLTLLLASQAFYLGLSFSALGRMQRDADRVLGAYVIEQLSRRLGAVTALGLGLERYASLPAEVEAAGRRARTEYLLVTDAAGRPLAGRVPPEGFKPPEISAPETSGLFTFSQGGRLWLGQGLSGPQGRPEFHIFLSGQQFDSLDQARTALKKRWPAYLAFNLAAAVLMFVVARRLTRGPELGRLRARLLFLAPFLLAQLGCYAVGLGDIFALHLEQKNKTARQLADHLAEDLERIAGQGIPLAALDDLPAYLGRLRGRMPNLARLAVLDEGGVTLASAPNEPAPEEEAGMRVGRELRAKSREVGRVEVWLSPAALSRDRRSLVLDNLTLTLAAGLLFMELARLLRFRPRAEADESMEEGGAAIMRPVAFLALMAMDMSLSFVPLKINELSGGFLGLPRLVVCGLPISLEMALTGLAMLGGGFFARSLGGWRPLFSAGLLTLAGGYGLSGLTGSPGVYILARGLAGAGYGLMNIAAQIFVITHSRPDRRGEALADLSAGFFSGGLCGCAAGGLLADRFGYDPVFFTSAAIFLILLNLVMLFMPAGRKPGATAGADRAALGRFLRSGPVWSFSLCCVGPICLASVGLINYFLPLHLSALGAGPALIGQLNALFSILVVLLAPVFGRCLDRSRRPWLFLVLAGFLAALAGPVLPLWPTVAGVLAALILLGLAAALSEGGEPAYLLGLPAARAL